MGCNEIIKTPGEVTQTDDNQYYGKLILNDSSKSIINTFVGYKTYEFDVMIGCECDDKVGDYTIKEDKDKNKDQTRRMKIAGTVLADLQENGEGFLDHIYVIYMKSNSMIVEVKVDLKDETKLEKVTVYTSSKTAVKKPVKESGYEEYNTLVNQESQKSVDISLDSNSTKFSDTTKPKKRIR